MCAPGVHAGSASPSGWTRVHGDDVLGDHVVRLDDEVALELPQPGLGLRHAATWP